MMTLLHSTSTDWDLKQQHGVMFTSHYVPLPCTKHAVQTYGLHAVYHTPEHTLEYVLSLACELQHRLQKA